MGSLGGSSGGSKPAGTTITQSKTDPWEKAQPHLEYGFDEARNIYESTVPEYYQGNTVNPLNQQQQTALQLQEARAVAGSPLNNQAQDLASQTIAGDFLNPNPFLQQNIDAATQGVTRNFQRAVMPGIDSAFSKAGRYGANNARSTQHDIAQENLAESLGNVASNMAFSNYAQERANQMNTMSQADAMSQWDYNDIAQLSRAGDMYRGQSDAELASDIDRWNFEQVKPATKLAQYQALIQGGNLGGTTTSSQPYFNNRGASALSGALGGAAVGGKYGGGTGALWGAALGGLGGLL